MGIRIGIKVQLWAWIFMCGVILPTRSYLSVELHGSMNMHGYYFVDVYIGNPTQKQSLIIDTGSSHIGFSCATCLQCGKHDVQPYNLSKSTTAKWCNLSGNDRNRCKYVQIYNEGSIVSGEYFEDILSFEESNSDVKYFFNGFRMHYNKLGCHEIETQLFINQNASGIMGLGIRNQDLKDNFINFLLLSVSKYYENENSDIILSLCLLKNGGIMNIGRYNDDIIEFDPANNNIEIKNQILWIPLVLDTSVYRVKLEIIMKSSDILWAFGNTEDTIGVVIDTGSTFSYFPKSIYKLIRKNFDQLCTTIDQKLGICQIVHDILCWTSIKDINNKFPNITMKFFGQPNYITWTYHSYLYKTNSGFWCLAIEEHKFQLDEDDIILGMSYLKNKQIILDPKNRMIGINSLLLKQCKKNKDWIRNKESKYKSNLELRYNLIISTIYLIWDIVSD
ncbi:eukaryotic aspartyl protease family protein [Cryptosporidium serpentis]